VSPFEYCCFAQKLGSSRGMALRYYRKQGKTIDADLFERLWRGARAAHRLQGLLGEDSTPRKGKAI
jgi:hypothetical protein